MKQVVSFYPNGSAQTILKDSFFNTRFLGLRRVDRLSEILFNEQNQSFYIRWLRGPLAGKNEPVNNDGCRSISSTEETRYFDTYENAVAFEINRVNNMRLDGVNFDA